MKKHRLLYALALAAALMCLTAAAAAETARVVTHGGQLNLRKTPEERGALVDTVPNRALVEIKEVGETWTLVTYRKKTGYVKTVYLKIPAQMEGTTVYADVSTLLLRSGPGEDAPAICPVSAVDPIRIMQVEGDWALAECMGWEGYLPVSGLTYQYAAPTAEAAWIREPGTVAESAALRKTPDADADAVADLAAGQALTVTELAGEWCLAVTEEGCGWVPVSQVLLTGPQDAADRVPGLAPMEAVVRAEEALTKKYKAFAKEKTYCIPAARTEKDGWASPVYHCGFFNGLDQYLFGAIVDAESGKVTFMASYAAFAKPVKTRELLPEGQVRVSLSADSLAVGEVLDITVEAWTEHSCQYALTRDGEAAAQSGDSAHFRAAYRSREAGQYALTVTVTDEEGRSETAQTSFTVTENETALTGAGEGQEKTDLPAVYSQKDGWWKDKKYRHSHLEKSGCAIFTLSSALQRLGHTEDAIRPENLAVTYASCLIKGEGTSNERLINLAAKAFGFKTRTALYKEEKDIVAFLRGGAFFSFSVARGHIALVSGISEDGSMARVTDSAPSATFERMVNCSLYYEMQSGAFRAALTPDDLPGARWYLETGEYGGLEYYVPVSYLARRGVRLIQPITE